MKVIRLVIVVLVLGTIAFAHHSQSQFDTTKIVTIEGKITQASWRNPHSLFFVDGRLAGATEGAAQQWVIEGASVQGLEKVGWTKDSAKPGEKLTITGNPRSDGKRELLLTSITLSNGTKFSFRPE